MAKLRHIAVTVPDLEAAARFYEDEIYGEIRLNDAAELNAVRKYLFAILLS